MLGLILLVNEKGWIDSMLERGDPALGVEGGSLTWLCGEKYLLHSKLTGENDCQEREGGGWVRGGEPQGRGSGKGEGNTLDALKTN